MSLNNVRFGQVIYVNKFVNGTQGPSCVRLSDFERHVVSEDANNREGVMVGDAFIQNPYRHGEIHHEEFKLLYDDKGLVYVDGEDLKKAMAQNKAGKAEVHISREIRENAPTGTLMFRRDEKSWYPSFKHKLVLDA